MDMTLVCAISDAAIDGALPSSCRTVLVTVALLTNCSMVCTSVGVTGCSAAPSALAWLEGCTRTWAEDAYCLGSVNEIARLTANPNSANAMTHHFRLRTSCA